MTKKFSFDRQLKKGEVGEQFFIKCYHKLNPRKSSTREVDIFINKNETVELKSDQTESDNFFIERYGDTENLKDGGPWKSRINDISYFVYYFVKEGTFYWFRTKELLEYLEDNYDRFIQKKVYNYGWFSTGLLVKKKEIKHLLIKKDTFNI